MLDLIPGTGSSNPPPSCGESANFRFLEEISLKPFGKPVIATGLLERAVSFPARLAE
jgi:hypothetical protein